MYRIERDFIYIDLPKNLAEKTNAVWMEKGKTWRLPNTIGVLEELIECAPRLMKDQQFVDYVNKRIQQRHKFLQFKNRKDAPGDSRLRPYQRVDVEFYKLLPHVAVFNQQRCGKTPTTLCAVESEGFTKNVVVCPASLLKNWEKEVQTWTHRESLLMLGSKQKRQNIITSWLNSGGFLIVSYETLRNDITTFSKCKIDALIVDECHRLGNPKSQQSKAVLTLGKNAKKRYALSGTPARNHGKDLYGILHFLYPERFPGYWQFVGRYFTEEFDYMGHRKVGGYKREAELQDILTVIGTNRKRSEVMAWLPKKTYSTVRLEPDPKQLKAYESVAKTFVYEEDGKTLVDAPSVLAQITRLRQICLAPELLDIKAGSPKEDYIFDWLEDNEGESVIIFSAFTSYLKRLETKLKAKKYKVGMIHGELSATQKNQAADDFQSGRTRILLANIISAGVGFTLDAAETAIFLDQDFTPINNEQAQDRLVPISEERNHPMNIISLVIADTYDEVINSLIDKKVNIIKVVNDSGVEGLKRLLNERE